MEIHFATLPDRIKAAVIDGIVLVAMMYGISELFALFETVPSYIRVIAFVFIFILYDPILISLYGATIGHSYINIVVKQENSPDKNIQFSKAIIRFILKSLLGWISLLTTTSNDKRKAIHDFVANSIVIKEIKK